MGTVEELVRPSIDAGAVLGAAVALLQDGEIVYLGGFGATRVGEGALPVTPRTLFSYGSISKTLCATLLMRLVEAGFARLDAPVASYLPHLRFSNPDYGGRLTLRHLLSHTSGLPGAGKDQGPRDPDALRRFVYEQIPRYAFLAAPGTLHLYSNTAFCVAGHVAEAVTGRPYGELIRAYVCDPLAMPRVTFDPAVALTHPVALPHASDESGELHVAHQLACNASGNPSGFALGSAEDLANLARMLLNAGRAGAERYLTPESIAEMQRPHGSRHIAGAAHPLAHTYQGYGLGLMLGEYQGRRVVRHGGVSQSYNCFFDLFPDDRAGVILLTNYSQDAPLMELLAALYDHILDIPSEGIAFLSAPPAYPGYDRESAAQRYSGSFLNIESADLATFAPDGDHLIMTSQRGTAPLVPIGQDQFYASFGENSRLPVAFFFSADATPLYAMIGGAPYVPWEIDQSYQSEPGRWSAFEGLYKDPSNPNPAEMLAVRLQDDRLTIAEGEHEAACRAISEGCFLSDLGLIEFERAGEDEPPILILGKATRFHPLDAAAFIQRGAIAYRREP